MGSLLPSPHRVHMGFTSLKTVFHAWNTARESIAVYPILKLKLHPKLWPQQIRDFFCQPMWTKTSSSFSIPCNA